MEERKSRFETIAGELAASIGFSNPRFRGRGAFKETYAVTALEGETRALKILDPETFNISRVEREISILLRCDCSLIVKIFNFGQFLSSNGTTYTYLVEEFLDGGTLTDQISGGDLTLDNIRNYTIKIAEAIEYLRQLNVVHRDIKPDNIMFKAGISDPILVDFGIIRDLSDSSLTPVWVPHGPGTAFFASPEQLNNDKHLIDWRTDQFSLGITIGICLTGKHPFCMAEMNHGDIIYSVASRSSCTDEYCSKVKELGFESTIRMLRPWPIDRYQSIADLVQSLRSEV